MYICLNNDNKSFSEFYNQWTGKEVGSYISLDCQDIVAKDDGKIVGALQLRIIKDPIFDRRWGMIDNVFVTPSARRRGIATKLMKFAEVQALGCGCKFVKLTSYKDKGKEFYRALGYEEGSAFAKGLE